MNNQEAYNQWAAQYDNNKNLTRDLEAKALQAMLDPLPFSSVLEIGCGTGKNSSWLAMKAKEILAVDFSEEMMKLAQAKLTGTPVHFVQADIRLPWKFTEQHFDLACCSLVLEHIDDLDFIFNQLHNKIKPGGYVYIGELHPFKQYTGSLARFTTEKGTVHLECFTHSFSAFINAAAGNGFLLQQCREWVDEPGPAALPRILSLLFRKS